MRQIKGLEIARKHDIKPTKDGWLVKSQSSEDCYKVTEDFVCTCPDSQKRNTTCKHSFAVRYYLQVEKDSPEGVKIEKVRLTYPQAWKAYDAAQTNEINLFDDLLKDLVQSIEEPAYSFGRPTMSKKDITFCCIQKAYSQLSARRAVSLFGRAVEKQKIGKKPHFTTMNAYMKDKELTPIFQRLLTLSAMPMKAVEKDFAIDSSGFRTRCFGQYAEEKYDLRREHKWIKAHACVGVKTNIITAVEIGEENSADSPQFAPLVKETAKNFNIEELSADKAYSSRENHEVAKEVGATAYIPFKSNATGNSKGSMIWKKAYLYFQLHADEFYEHYHKRSNVESTFGAIKKKFGDTLKAKSETGQKNELLCKIIAYNITVLIHEMFEMGIKPNFQS